MSHGLHAITEECVLYAVVGGQDCVPDMVRVRLVCQCQKELWSIFRD